MNWGYRLYGFVIYYLHICLAAAAAAAKLLQSCPTLCDPIDSRPPGFPIPGILQARTLEWVAISVLGSALECWVPGSTRETNFESPKV